MFYFFIRGQSSKNLLNFKPKYISFSFQVREVYDSVIMAEYERVKEAFEEPDKILGFLDYVERCWLGRKLASSVKKPKFPVAIWNLFDSAISGCSMTNNSSEGCNSAWATALPSNTSLWMVMAKFREVGLCLLF